MNTVKDILTRKGSNAVFVTSGTSVLDMLKVMADKNIGSVVVKSPDGNFLGITTERDYSRKVILQGKSSTEVMVEEIMSHDLPTVSPQDSIEHCMQLMTSNNIRYLPVFFNLRLEGIISMSDVVKETILNHEETISHLKEYINQ